jgi:hypothetical protein
MESSNHLYPGLRPSGDYIIVHNQEEIIYDPIYINSEYIAAEKKIGQCMLVVNLIVCICIENNMVPESIFFCFPGSLIACTEACR